CGEVRLERDTGRRRHVGDSLDEFLEIALEVCIQLDDPHLRLEAVLVIDGAGHPDRLVCRAEMPVATDLCGDVTAQAADAGDVITLGGLGQLPPDMDLA